MNKWPDSNLIKVDEKGCINFTLKQWKFLVKLSGTKAKTEKGQYNAVKKLVEKAIKRVLKK